MNSAHELSTLINALRSLHHDAAPKAALATLTRTRGSTFRRPGTRMLVFDDGRVVCELSGGCPQRDIVVRALEVITHGQPRLVRYNADSGLDVLIEMGCGGELEVLIEPLLASHDTDFIDTLARCLDERRHVHMATLFAVDGTAVIPRRQIWSERNVLHESIDDPALSQAIIDNMPASSTRRARTVRLPSARGVADVLVEAIMPPHALVIIGSSAAARALLPLASALGWQTTLVDHDPARLQAYDLPAGLNTVCAAPENLPHTLPLDAHSSVVVMTHNLEQDVAYLSALKDMPVTYIGALGSRERVARMRSNSTLNGLHVHAPAGLDIGSETPEEIALAIAAEIMAVINQRAGGSLRDNDGTIHG
ncbi:xanthine dehydrogenase accessory factor [Dyella lipolytica]|uniref:XdhC family protein n=1 Tax=Dyella lipolytica TaxID=1867835 RepID=A0ABW8IXW6_9GAMM|nr:XdhC/CoxI family protein [Dyella lipolytica]GLQ46004.1 xanthine dehydrogenase accessory factor [Dyella lipolytica]